mgnify:CR=1 FL=1
MKKEIRVKSDISVRSAMNKLEKTAEKCLIVVDGKGKLLGTLTDGEIRRSPHRESSTERSHRLDRSGNRAER